MQHGITHINKARMEKSRHDLKIGRKEEKKKNKDESRTRFGTGEEKRKTRKMNNCH